MLRCQPATKCVIHQHVGIRQVQPAEAEIYGRFCGVDHIFGEITTCTQPGQDAIALPTPRNDLFLGYVRAQMPVIFLRVLLDALVQTVIIPSERDLNSFLSGAHLGSA